MIIGHKGHKIFAFSDTHGMYRRLTVPEADVLICAGDACEGFNPADLKDFFDWYSSQPAKLRIFVPGNHDPIFDQAPARARPFLKAPVIIPSGTDFLITHGPAFGYLDRDQGDKQLYLAIATARPAYHIFGHVHEEGQKRKAMLGTTYLNVSYFVKLLVSLH